METNELHKKLFHAIWSHENEASGNQIRDAYEAKHGLISIGILYSTLGILEREGYVVYKTVPGGPERGYRDKRIYSLTGHGLAEIRREID